MVPVADAPVTVSGEQRIPKPNPKTQSRNQPIKAVCLLAALVVATSSVRGAANINSQSPHERLNIFPASAIGVGNKIEVDGDLSDWKPAAFVLMAADPQLRDVYAVRFAAAYDDKGLLLAADVTDPSPLVNHIDPGVNPEHGWNGDALQVRFITDPQFPRPVPAELRGSDKIVHCTLWQFSDKQLPALHACYGMS